MTIIAVTVLLMRAPFEAPRFFAFGYGRLQPR